MPDMATLIMAIATLAVAVGALVVSVGVFYLIVRLGRVLELLVSEGTHGTGGGTGSGGGS